MLSQFHWRSGLALLLSAGVVGCLSFSLEIGGRRSSPSTDPVLCQSGSICLQPGELRPVYYPVAYHTPPNLEVASTGLFFKRVDLLEQHRDHFSIRSPDPAGMPIEVRWTAKGLPVTVALPAPPVLLPSEGPPVVPPPLVNPPTPRPLLPPAP